MSLAKDESLTVVITGKSDAVMKARKLVTQQLQTQVWYIPSVSTQLLYWPKRYLFICVMLHKFHLPVGFGDHENPQGTSSFHLRREGSKNHWPWKSNRDQDSDSSTGRPIGHHYDNRNEGRHRESEARNSVDLWRTGAILLSPDLFFSGSPFYDLVDHFPPNVSYKCCFFKFCSYQDWWIIFLSEWVASKEIWFLSYMFF